jgi:hypothetical protein
MGTIDTKRQFTSHCLVQIYYLTPELGLCYYLEYLLCTKNITVYAMINIKIKPYVYQLLRW